MTNNVQDTVWSVATLDYIIIILVYVLLKPRAGSKGNGSEKMTVTLMNTEKRSSITISCKRNGHHSYSLTHFHWYPLTRIFFLKALYLGCLL